MTERKQLFKVPRPDSTRLTDRMPMLPGGDPDRADVPMDREAGPLPRSERVGYRSFDRQWLIADGRLIDRPRPDLWTARRRGQVFVVEQHAEQIKDGPGVVLAALLPDMHHFNNRGRRVLPLLHPGGRPNVAPGLLNALATLVGGEVFEGSASANDLLAYLAAVVAHPAYTETFADELATPGIRVPVTADPVLWKEAVELGAQVVWTHTFGEAAVDAAAGRKHGDVRFPPGDERRVRQHDPMTGMPSTLTYDASTQRLALGSATWGPVRPEVVDYAVGGRNVLHSWLNYRKGVPGGKKTSPLDRMHVTSWPEAWSTELTELLSLLTRLVEHEPAQAALLHRVMAGPLLTLSTLATHGVQWPTTVKDRKPRYDEPPSEDAPVGGQLAF